MKATGSRRISNAPDGMGNEVDDRHKHPCTRARVSAWRRALGAGALFSLLALALPPTAFAGTSAVTTEMAYVSDEGDVAVIDVATGHKIKNIGLPKSSYLQDGSTQPGYIAVAPNQQTAYVTTLNSLVPINLSKNTAETPIPLGITETNGSSPGTAGHVVISPDGNTAYVTDWKGGNVIAINLQSGTHTNIKVGSDPAGVAITPDGNTLVVSNYGSDNVSVINLSTNQVTKTLSLPGGAAPEGIAVTPDGSSAYVSQSEMNDLASINLSSLTESNSAIAVNNGTWDLAITPDGSKAYITDSNSVVTPLDLANGQAGTAISSNLYHPTGVAISPDGKWAYVTDYGFGYGTGGQVTPINVSTNTPSSPIVTGPYSLGVAFANITQQASVLSVSLSGTKPSGGHGLYSTPVKVTIHTTNSSNPTKYSLDGGATWKTYSAPVTVTAVGEHTLTYGWTDVGGTVHTEGSTSFDIGQLAPDLTTATVGSGSIGSQSTTKVSVTPQTQGDTFAYVLGNSPAASPFLGDPLKTDAKPYISNTDINSANTGQYLDIYEINSQNQVQAWHEFQLNSNDIQVAVGAATVVPSKTTVLSGQAVTVTGFVYDVYEHGVPGAKVMLTSPIGSWQTPFATTDASGLYSDTWTAPTTWTNTNATVTASVYGTNPAVQKQVAIQVEAATPDAPMGLQDSDVTSTGWKESWSAVNGAIGYNVYIDGAKVTQTPISVTSYHVTGLAPDASYSITVTSVSNGKESTQSQPMMVHTHSNPLTISVNPPVTSPASDVSVSGNAIPSTSISLSADGGSWNAKNSTVSTVYSVYSNAQGTYDMNWTAPTTPGVYTLSAMSDGTTVAQPIDVTTLNDAVTTTPFMTSNTSDEMKSFTNLGNPGNQTSNVQIDVPKGTFGTDTSVFITSTSDTSNITPSGTDVVADVGVNFEGTPQQPMTLTVQNPNIQSGDMVYKVLSNGTYQQIPSNDITVTSGQAVITFQNDPIFVVTKSIGGGPVAPTIIQDSFTEPAQVGQKYSATIHEIRGIDPMKWTVTKGILPLGLALNNEGVVSGTPTRAGTYTFTIKVTDACSQSSTKQLTLSVNGTTSTGGSSTTTPMSVTTSKVQSVGIGHSVNIDLQANGGQKPYRWSVAGTLPKGLNLNRTTGVISGTPVTPGLRQVTVKVTGAQGTTSDQTITLDVLRTYEREVLWEGNVKNVPAIVRKEGSTETTYMPIWYVMQLLKPMGIHSTWDGKLWHMTASSKPNMSNIKVGNGNTSIYLNDTLVQMVNTVAQNDPSTNKPTTYMPIWYVMQLLKRVGLQSTWNGTTWTVTKYPSNHSQSLLYAGLARNARPAIFVPI